jgi:plastocyanin
MLRTLLIACLASVTLLGTAGKASAQTTHTVNLWGFSFVPNVLDIQVGDRVKWVWVTGDHNVVSGSPGAPDGNFYSGGSTSVPGTTFTVLFDAAFLAANPMPGDQYPYFCEVHGAAMVGLIRVNTGIPPSSGNYGCGVNPAGSLVELGGQPIVGATWTLGVDNPLGTQPVGSLALLAVSTAADPAYPCGTPVPGYGMAAPGTAGELLIGLGGPNPLFVLGPAVWGGAGTPAAIPVTIPSDPTLAGLAFYFQGLMADPTFTSGIPLAMTEGMEATIGS